METPNPGGANPGGKSSGSWLKGVSGNPGGRPKQIVKLRSGRIVDMAEEFRKRSPAALKVVMEIMLDENQPGALRLQAAALVFDRGYGKAVQDLKINAQSESVVRVVYPQLEPIQWQARWQEARMRAYELPAIDATPQETTVERVEPAESSEATPAN